jgi:dipeptidase D
MERVLSNLEPGKLWSYFEDICSIPHPSKKEEKIIAYVKKFGEDLGLDTYVDHVGNIMIRKPAAKGYENRKTVVLQSHLDMVPQKNNDTVHDFENDPIKVTIDQDWVKAKGTTLGADNGIGAAAAMAILENNDLKHGPIECLFTIDEETGMTGAFALKEGLLKADILINLDSEDEGELYIGCAGGIDTSAVFKYETINVVGATQGYDIVVKGLKGGHSGLDIHLGRGNANKLLNRILWQANRDYKLQIANISGGSLRNAIPRESMAKVILPLENADKFEKFAEELSLKIKYELKNVEPDLEIITKGSAVPSEIIDPEVTGRLLNALYACPNGVIRVTDDMPDVVETSTNLAIVNSSEGKIEVNSLQRSSVDSAKDDLCNMIRSVFELAGATVEHTGSYPGWKPNLESPILKTMKKVYNQMHGKVPQVKVIHAGLECGILGGIYPNLDMISFGPTIRNPHSPDEMVNIKTVGLFWDFLVETLENIPEK